MAADCFDAGGRVREYGVYFGYGGGLGEHLVVGVVGLVVIASPFYGGPTLTLGKTEITNPPFWQVLVTFGVIAPLLWIAIAALTSQKAKEEFTTIVGTVG